MSKMPIFGTKSGPFIEIFGALGTEDGPLIDYKQFYQTTPSPPYGLEIIRYNVSGVPCNFEHFCLFVQCMLGHTVWHTLPTLSKLLANAKIQYG